MRNPWIALLTSVTHSVSKSSPAGSGLFDELQGDIRATRRAVVIGFLIGVAVIALAAWIDRKNVTGQMYVLICFWALACYALGALVGFLFGIPRVIQNPPRLGSAQSGTAGEASQTSSGYELMINTNLDDISDWLTKIIVGVGLVEIREASHFIYRWSSFIAGSAGTVAVPLVSAIIIYFSVIGFMSGYLTTRLFFERAFRIADLAAEGIGDREVSERKTTETAAALRPAEIDLKQ